MNNEEIERMNPEEVARKFIEGWDNHDSDAIAEVLDQDYVFFGPTSMAQSISLKGKETFQKLLLGRMNRFKTFPDLKMEITNIVARDNAVALEYIETATFKGPLELPTGTIPPTNRSYKMSVALFFQVNSKGLIVETRVYFDTADLLQQLGVSIESIYPIKE